MKQSSTSLAFETLNIVTCGLILRLLSVEDVQPPTGLLAQLTGATQTADRQTFLELGAIEAHGSDLRGIELPQVPPCVVLEFALPTSP
jgi:hypothetical protein